MTFPPGHLSEHPLPPGVCGSLGIGGYQLLAEVAGVGAGRLGSQAFLLVAPDPDPRLPDAHTHLALHEPRLRDDAGAMQFVRLAGQLGYLRLSGYRLVTERAGLRSRVHVLDPASGAIAVTVPERHGGGLMSRGTSAERLLAAVRALPPAGAAIDPANSELLREALLALALRDERVTGAQAPELVERALMLLREDPRLDPPAALEAAVGK